MLFRLFFSLMFLKIDSGDGAGSGDGGSGEFDYDALNIDNADNPNNSNNSDSNPGVQPPKQNNDNDKSSDEDTKVKDLESKIEEQQKFIDEQKNIQAINEAVGDIKNRISDFSIDAVYAHLKEMHKTDPQKANAYNNPIGWENIWNQIKPNDVKNDRVNYGRNTAPVERDEEVFAMVKNGGASFKDEADVLGKLL